jgi:CRISPR/Cas system-associated endonuclease Cas1
LFQDHDACRDGARTLCEVKILFLEQPNVLMSVKDRVLVLKFTREIFSLPRDCRTIVANGYGFAITGAAIKECIARNIELIISDNTGSFVCMFTPEPMMEVIGARSETGSNNSRRSLIRPGP